MTDHERLREQYEDALFALLMEGVAESEGEEALRLNEELKKDPNAEVPKDVQKRCEKTIRSAFAQKQLRATGRTAARWLIKVAVVAVLGGLMFTAAFALSEDVRVATLNALIQVMDDRTEITFEGEVFRETSADVTSEAENEMNAQYNIAIDWLPSGYEFQQGQSNDTTDEVIFLSPVNGSIRITYTLYDSSTTYNVNTEGCTQKEVIIQGHPASLYITNQDVLQKRFVDIPNIWSYMTIYWIDDINNAIVEISATNLTEDEIIQLANGVHHIN